MNQVMKEKKFKVDGIEYTVKATTEDGLKRAEKAFKKSIKRTKQTPTEGHGI